MNTSFIPATQDSALLLENAITKTATFNGTTFDFGSGFAPGGVGQPIGAVINITAIDTTTGDETYSFKVQESADGVTWTDASVAVAASAVGMLTVPAFVSQRYVRLSLTEAGTTPSATYSAWLNPYINPN